MNTFSFGARSREKLKTCHPALMAVMTRALELSPFDLTIIHGWRGEEIQDALYQSGASKTPWPRSKHNHMEGNLPMSLAVDVAPWLPAHQPTPIPWKDEHLFCVMAGVVFAAATERNVTLRWGGDWDMDRLTTDQTFMDWGHFELAGEYSA